MKVKCPKCVGTGKAISGRACPACRGECEVSKEQADKIRKVMDKLGRRK